MIRKFLQAALIANSYHFSDELQEKFVVYLNLLQHWNRVFNLTAIRDPKEMVYLHILDSLSISPFLHGKRIIDVGSGAGFPGIPLALINTDKEFLLLDSSSKKTRFLTQVINELKIGNVKIMHVRCEDFHPEKCFNTVVARAFSSLDVMLTKTQHLLCKDGQFLAMKGIYPEKELAKIPDEFKVLTVHSLRIKGLEADRCLVCLEKQSKS